jgi:hypothetical protein
MSEEKVEVVPLTKMKEGVSYCFAYLVLIVFFQLQHQFGRGPIFKAEIYSVLVRLGDVLRGQVYCSHDYHGLIDLSVVSRCPKYCRCRYHCRIEHPLVSRIMVIEFNLINPQRDLL